MSIEWTNLNLRDSEAYRLGYQFLLAIEGVTKEMVEKHLSVSECVRPTTLSGVFSHLAFSAQNYWGLPHIIGCKLGPNGVDELAEVLCDFEPRAVVREYGTDWKSLLNRIDEDFFPEEPRERGPRSVWRKYCRALLTGAKWLTCFENAGEFYRWVERHDQNATTRFKSASTIAEHVHGYGPALACDFVKELGFVNWSKPDVHLKKIFVGLELAESEDNWTVFKAIDRVATNAGVMPYRADKVFWLISSGRFYLDEVEVGNHRDRFISYARKQLDKGS